MKYKKKPVVVEAFQYDGDLKGNNGYYVPQWAVEAFERGVIYYDSIDNNSPPCELFVKTLEGVMLVKVGSYLIKGIKGELYPCDEDIFEKTYEIVK